MTNRRRWRWRGARGADRLRFGRRLRQYVQRLQRHSGLHPSGDLGDRALVSQRSRPQGPLGRRKGPDGNSCDFQLVSFLEFICMVSFEYAVLNEWDNHESYKLHMWVLIGKDWQISFAGCWAQHSSCDRGQLWWNRLVGIRGDRGWFFHGLFWRFWMVGKSCSFTFN